MGIFDRSTAGQKTPPIEVTLERGAIAFFAETIGETNPIHFDVDAARAAGHPDVVAPATYPVVVGTFAGKESMRRGLPGIHAIINADFRCLLHGTESYIYHGPIHAGETVSVENEVLGFADAKGGKLEIAQVATRITHPERGLLVEAKRDIIHVLG
ncbi:MULTISPECIES: FAS1-like dehydratase domain-containing protein [Shimia]|uniref:FAS1-like dehydratase domain-containing protein n=1 Tax=Shimia TaxID=573139 RepID=UPI001FB26A84|nr:MULTISPECIES: MaoC family dehydratase N-terminal domain-containing protein [Shimia]MDV4143440.1 MaoC family dehydratase N-terminal domain-containing protein [Shimia sp. FJ5]